MAKVTIVIATYNRPKLLTSTIKSILAQTYKEWVLLVVGDCCSPETGKVLEAFSDDRIFYVNLANRCGEQSGPNTAGMFAASTPYVAFANHDDVWLSDHLERAVLVLEEGKAEFFVGRAAITAIHEGDGGEKRGAIRALSPEKRSVAEGINRNAAYFEPVSTWVVTRQAALTVGAWSPAGTIFRTPAEDWILRAWRKNIRLHFDDLVTAIYCTGVQTRAMRSQQAVLTYETLENETEFWWQCIKTEGNSFIRGTVQAKLKGLRDTAAMFRHPFEGTAEFGVFQALQNEATTKLYKLYSWDGFSEACKLIGKEPGFHLRTALRKRTGEALGIHGDWENIIMQVGVALSSNDKWKAAQKS